MVVLPCSEEGWDGERNQTPALFTSPFSPFSRPEHQNMSFSHRNTITNEKSTGVELTG